MLSKKLSKEIQLAAEEMSMTELLNYLQGLECQNKLELNYDGWDYVIGFAKHLVDSMKASLDKDEWFGYEIRALIALEEEISCGEYDLIKINTYGFPCEIEDNEELLYLLGVDDQLVKC